MSNLRNILIAFDIDGVLNPTVHDPIPACVTDRWPDMQPPTALITRVPSMIRRVNELLARHPEVTPMWCTSWEENAAWFGEQVGLTGSSDWEWLPAVGDGAVADWQKFISIRERVERDQPDLMIWCEDDLVRRDEDGVEIRDPEVINWVSDPANNTVAVAPLPGVGLSPRDLDRIEQLIERCLQS